MERTVERWEEALLSRLFRGGPVRLIGALRRECDDHAVVCNQNRVLVPNVYRVELEGAVHDELARRGGDVGRDLADVLVRHAAAHGYEWAGPLTVQVSRASNLPNRRYRIASDATAHIAV